MTVADILQACDSLFPSLRMHPSCLRFRVGRHRKQTYVLIRLFSTMLHDNCLRTVEKHRSDHRFPLFLRHRSFLLSTIGRQPHQRSIPSWQRKKHHFRYDGRSSTFWLRHWHGLGWCLHGNDRLAVGFPRRSYYQFLHVRPCCLAVASYPDHSQAQNLVAACD